MRPPSSRAGWQLTPRDADILSWIGWHGIVTREQLARRFFAHCASPSPAYKRIAKLAELGLLRGDPTFREFPDAIRLTRPGRVAAGVPLSPARLSLTQLRHSLALVDLVEALLRDHPHATVTTERELRAQWKRESSSFSWQPAGGRIADGVLQEDGRRIAIELDLSFKSRDVLEHVTVVYRDVHQIIAGYQHMYGRGEDRYHEVWWFVSPRRVSRVAEIVRDARADDFISVMPWTPASYGPDRTAWA